MLFQFSLHISLYLSLSGATAVAVDSSQLRDGPFLGSPLPFCFPRATERVCTVRILLSVSPLWRSLCIFCSIVRIPQPSHVQTVAELRRQLAELQQQHMALATVWVRGFPAASVEGVS